MKKVFISILTIALIIFNASICFADYNTVIMSVIEKPVNEIKFSENSGFTKSLVSEDLNNKEVTIELKVNNDEKVIIPKGEVVILMDNSESMNQVAYDGKTRKEIIISATKELISSLLDSNDELKIAIAAFSTKSLESEGTLEDAKVLQELTDNENELDNSLDMIEMTGYRTDLQAGIEVAKTLFTTNDVDKYMVILTDGLPNVCLYDQLSNEDQEIAKKEFYCQVVIDQTVKSLESLKEDDINVISMLTGINDPDKKPTQTSEYTYKQYYEKVFGTPSDPTVGKFFYTEDKNVETTITKDILEALKPASKTIKDITITDVFPLYIIENFDFAYVKNVNIGTITNLDISKRTITWEIPELKPGEIATCQYVLKLKQNFSQDIVSKNLKTNENVEISYTGYDDKKYEKENDVTPVLKLEEPPAELPKAGNYPFMFLVISSVVLTFILLIRYIKLK